MHIFRDADAPLLLATLMASKRRAADLVGVIAALDLILEGAIPPSPKLIDSFGRLSTHGLIAEVDGGYVLTAEGEKMVVGLPKKATSDERVDSIREDLAGYPQADDHPAVELTVEAIHAAVLAHRASKSGTGRNMLMPKTKAAEAAAKRAAQWRHAAAARRRKAQR
ncbi:hypothetical protein [Denitromonas halophila]|uniref:Uncharacterized protein n=1 Tax=Denitromonas halophila TaxID=1629404 RepID=A0A557QER7_9RHOO|nr:hypothetical protein [Denitromonas halophila]TVO51412.1 hypothetical protein FHP91_19775 [Denitromonas halophila]